MNLLRVSSYIILVELADKKTMLIHGYSGAIDIVTSDIANLLQQENIQAIIQQGEDTVKILQRRGYLTLKTKEEEYAYVERMALALHKRDSLIKNSFTIVVTYNCNFRCPYCFEKNSILEDKRSACFTPEMVDKAYLFIKDIQPNENLRAKQIVLFGGEPLLKENKDIVSYIIEKGKLLNFTFSAITNGYDLEAYFDLLAPNSINHVQITIDGTETMHNSKRIHFQGVPTFKKIVTNIGEALKRDISVTVRFNTDKKNFDELEDLEKLFNEMHYTDNPHFIIDSARLINYEKHSAQDNVHNFLTPEEFINKHSQLNFKYGCHDFGAYDMIYSSIIKQVPIQYRPTFCGAQTGSYVLDPLGKIYTCWDLVGKKDFQIGDYSSQPTQWNTEMLNQWRKNDITQYASCSTCKCALLCGGGCLAHNLDKHKCTHMLNIINYAAHRAYNKFKSKSKVYERE
ncbi:SPASM domain-containing protein [Bacteroides sp.]|uniref:radical SAM/SPASM domain-containing protein n=1 Tax=Bacteroides sp. TaxID=29523 RepID=UPI00260AB4A5|nr:SPASM domain-containing protein [Bacteroides sp.]